MAAFTQRGVRLIISVNIPNAIYYVNDINLIVINQWSFSDLRRGRICITDFTE